MKLKNIACVIINHKIFTPVFSLTLPHCTINSPSLAIAYKYRGTTSMVAVSVAVIAAIAPTETTYLAQCHPLNS